MITPTLQWPCQNIYPATPVLNRFLTLQSWHFYLFHPFTSLFLLMQKFIFLKFDATTSGNRHQTYKSNGMKKTIVAYGELLWDLLPTGKVLGGATTNFIFRVKLFGNNGFLISRVGDDENGHEAIQKLQDLGLAIHHIQTDPGLPTGTVPVILDAQGKPDFTIIPNVAYDHITLTGDLLHLASMADCIYFGTLSQRSPQSKNTLHTLLSESPQAIKFLDINLRRECFSEQIVRESLEAADILKINDEEIGTLKGMIGLQGDSLRDLARDIVLKYGLKLALVTLGEKGAFAVAHSGSYFYDPGYRVTVQDTVGSGDAFSAAFMHYYLGGHAAEEALRFGNATGALVAASVGCTSHVPAEEVVRFMNTPRERLYQ